jgi:hypothetical protein
MDPAKEGFEHKTNIHSPKDIKEEKESTTEDNSEQNWNEQNEN